MTIINLLDLITTLTGTIGTIILCFFPSKQSHRFFAFCLYVVANLSLGILAHLKGIPLTSYREIIYLICSFAGIYNDWPHKK